MLIGALGDSIGVRETGENGASTMKYGWAGEGHVACAVVRHYMSASAAVKTCA